MWPAVCNLLWQGSWRCDQQCVTCCDQDHDDVTSGVWLVVTRIMTMWPAVCNLLWPGSWRCDQQCVTCCDQDHDDVTSGAWLVVTRIMTMWPAVCDLLWPGSWRRRWGWWGWWWRWRWWIFRYGASWLAAYCWSVMIITLYMTDMHCMLVGIVGLRESTCVLLKASMHACRVGLSMSAC